MRPRDPHIDGAVLDATVEELSLVGYARLRLEAVARRAGTTKPSIYRRWPSRQDLVLAALVERLGAGAIRAPDSGCVVCDLVGGVDVFVAAFRRMPAGALGALLTDCAGQPGLRAAFMRKLFEPPRSVVGRMVDRAKARGDLRADLDRELAVDLLGALVHYRALFDHASTDREAAEGAVVTLLRGMAADYGELAGRKIGHEHELG
jgi:AcrR family transcriptional regulator